MLNFKETTHTYKGFIIKGSTIVTSGGWVLGMRHWKEGGVRRNYNVLKNNGKYLWHPDTVIQRLKDAKDQIDNYLKYVSRDSSTSNSNL